MLAPAGAIAAGGLYTATEFDVDAFDPLRPSLVEMGRAVVRDGHRNGGVVLLMWAGILAYLDRYGYDYVTGCVSVPIGASRRRSAGQPAPRGARLHPEPPRRTAAVPGASRTGRCVVDGKALDDIAPPARPAVPPLMRGYLRLGAQVCGEPAHDPDFGVGDFCVLLDKRRADTRYLKRLRSVSAATEMAGGTDERARGTGHAWLPRASCDVSCVGVGGAAQSRRLLVTLRVALRITLALVLLPGMPLLGVPLPGRTQIQRAYCRLVLRCFGVRITVSGSPIRNLRGVLVVSGHVSWLDVFAIGAVLPGSFVARADMFTGFATGVVARILKIIPIERSSLRRLPDVVDAVARRLRAGQTVVAFPEGTTWCGRSAKRTGVRILLPGDVPGRDRRRPAGAAAAADAITTSTAACRPPRPSSATTLCCGRSAGCSPCVARWRGCTSNPCSCRAPTGALWPAAASPRCHGGSPASAHPGHGHALVA